MLPNHSEAQCGDYDVKMDYFSGPDACGYYAYDVVIESNSTEVVRGVEVQIEFTIGTTFAAFFDHQSTSAVYTWLPVSIGQNGVTFMALAPAGITFKNLERIGRIVFCGRESGTPTIDINADLRDANFDPCAPQNVFPASVTFPNETLYEGIIQKQPANCTNMNNGIEGAIVKLFEQNNEPFANSWTTNFNGIYSFLNGSTAFHALQNQCYEICPVKGEPDNCLITQNDLNRVTSFMLVQYCPTAAWEKLAWDVNNDDQVSTADQIILQSIINGTFDYGTHQWKYWKFVHSPTYNAMPVNCNQDVPTYDECLSVSSSNALQNNGWYGVISGDADGSCTTCSLTGNQTREKDITQPSKILLRKEKSTLFADVFLLPGNNLNVQGAELKITGPGIVGVSIENTLDDESASVITTIGADNHIKYSFVKLSNDFENEGQRLFSIKLDMDKNISTEEIGIELVSNEALNGVGVGMDVYPITVEVHNESHPSIATNLTWVSGPFGLYFTCSEQEKATQISIYDISGKRLVDYPELECEESIPIVAPSGLYIVQYKTHKGLFSNKIVLK